MPGFCRDDQEPGIRLLFPFQLAAPMAVVRKNAPGLPRRSAVIVTYPSDCAVSPLTVTVIGDAEISPRESISLILRASMSRSWSVVKPFEST